MSPVPRSGVMKVVAGEPAELRCNVTQGSPRPEITWKRKVGGERGEGRDNLITATVAPCHYLQAQTFMLSKLD